MPEASLSKLYGLRADTLSCPSGGTHKVDDSDLVNVSKVGGGRVLCLACGGIITLTRSSS